jgi:HEAT repeat protein
MRGDEEDVRLGLVWGVLLVSQVMLLVATLFLVAANRTWRTRRVRPSWVTSRFWWRRFAAAQRLAQVGGERDEAAIRRLLADPHPAVQSAGSECLLRFANEALVAQVLDGLITRTPAVQAYQINVLRRVPALVEPLLLRRIRADAPPAKLNAYIAVARTLDSRDCVERVASLSVHPNAEVRVAVARALRMTCDETNVIKLLAMLRDPDWRVRAQAARGLGTLRDERAIKALARAMTDSAWWVRFRAGLSLALLGDMGRQALDDLRTLPDRFGRDMAMFVSGLSEASIAELASDT